MIYRVLDISHFGEAEYRKVYEALPLWRKEKAEKLKLEVDRRRSVFSYALLVNTLEEYFGKPLDKDSVYADEKGKLWLKDLSAHVSISHSGDYVACAVSEGNVGIDIESKRKIQPQTLRKVLNSSELEFVLSSGTMPTESIDSLSGMGRRFLRIWTAKEARLKYTGEGLEGLGSADIGIKGKRLFIDRENTELISLDCDDYVLSVVYSET